MFPIAAVAQAPSPTPAEPAKNSDRGDRSQQDDSPDGTDKAKKAKRGRWLFAPIPVRSPAFGTGIIVAAGYIFSLDPEDKVSPPSTIGTAVVFTNNGSRGIVAGARLYFDENKYQTTFGFGTGKANYEFFGIGQIPGEVGSSVLIKQNGGFVFGEFMRNFGKNIFIGPRYQYRRLSARRDENAPPGSFEIPDLELKSTTAAIGFHVQRDLRNSTYYPTKGSLFDFKADFFAKPLGSNRNYQAYSVAYNGFHSLGDRQVLAYRGMACSVSDRTPFFDLCLFGARGDLRGYTAGEFQDRRMFATQAEYRRELPWRLGFVAFAGFGGVARRWDELRFDNLLPAGGVGLRFKLDKVNHINYRVDLGFGRGGSTLSFSVTEAF